MSDLAMSDLAMSDHVSAATTMRARFTPLAAVLVYVFLLVACIVTIFSTLEDLQARQAGVEAIRAQAARLLARGAASVPPDAIPQDIAPDPAFLGGDKLSVASAELQRRVTTIVTNAGGNVLSSQVERQEAKGPASSVELTVEWEIEPTRLQGFLYELESRAPFVFIEQMSLRSRNDSRDGEGKQRLRASIRLLAYWRNPEP